MKNLLVILVLFFSLLSGISKSNSQPSNGLIAYYPFNGNAKDQSGNDNNGKVFGASLTKDRFGISDRAYHFSGFNNPCYIKIPNDPSLNITNKVSFSIWAKIDDKSGMNMWGSFKENGGNHCLFAKDHDRTGLCGIIVFDNKIDVINVKWGFADKYGNSKINVDVEKWHHFVIMFTKSSYEVYEDNILIGKGVANIDFTTTNNRDLFFGKFSDAWYPLNGDLDDIRIYDRELNENEISQLYHEGGW
jgi:hypothetical protein